MYKYHGDCIGKHCHLEYQKALEAWKRANGKESKYSIAYQRALDNKDAVIAMGRIR